MNLKKVSFVSLMAAMIFFAACNNRSIKLEFTNAKEEVPLLGNLTFRFSHALVSDSILNVWDSSDYVSFEPKIEGKFRWETNDQLVFSPANPLLPATTYHAKINQQIFKHTKFNALKNADDIHFHTPTLQFNGATTLWTLPDEQTKIPIAQLDLIFNYKVNPTLLKDKLQLQLEGNNLDYRVISESASETITIQLTGLKAEDKNYNAKVIIAKGLLPEGGMNATVEEQSAFISIPSPFELAVQNIESQHDGVEGIITITTNQQPIAAGLSAFVKITPQLKFTTEVSNNGFVIRSNGFDVGQAYTITLLHDLKGNIGGTLKEDYTNNISFGELEPAIVFTNSKGVYLSKRGSKNLEVKITAIPKIKLVISKIYENNLMAALNNGYSPNEDRQENFNYNDATSNFETQFGDIIYEKEIETRTLPKSAGGRILNLSQFEDRLQNFKGIYHIQIRSASDYWQSDSRFISMSDIGLIAKAGTDKITVFANSIKDATGLSNAKIQVFGSNNQLIGSGNTNAEGIAEITYSKYEFSGFKPMLIVAKTADDFNYLPFGNTLVNTSRFDVGGKTINRSDLDAFIYLERDIYRPGEKVNFAAIIRSRDWQCPGDLLLKMKFLMPNGKELKVFRKNLNEQGSVEGSVDIATSAITGTYTLEVYTSNDVLLGSKNIMIEEFVPDRIKVDFMADKNILTINDNTKLHLTATNLFGPPAANKNYECEIQIKQKYFTAKQFEGFDFSLNDLSVNFEKIEKQGQTDNNGKAELEFATSQTYAYCGLLQATCFATVFDETGRPVSKNINLDIATQKVFYGIKSDGYYYYSLNQPINFSLCAANKDGNSTSGKAKLKMIKHEYRTVLSRDGSYFRYESQKEDKLLDEKDLMINSIGNYVFTPHTSGDYELRLYADENAKSYVSRQFYSYGSWGNSVASFEVNNEGQVDISFDKKNYFAGETAKILFKTPFDGKLLVTTENDKIQSTKNLTVEKRTASMDLKVNSKDLPNIYVSATLIKPHDVSDIPLTVAHGYANAKVEERSRKIAVEIVAQKKSRSHSHQHVKVKAAANAYVTLAAVDNGVLQITNFPTPDPYNYFYQKRALGIASYDIYPLLFPEVRAKLSSSGGDGSNEMNKRTNPMQAKRFKIMTYWSGIKKCNGNGEADFDFDIAQFNGEVRLMAVAHQNKNFGSAENTIKVADPIVISTPLPRFLSPGDTVTIPVSLSNTTSKTTQAKATISLVGAIKTIGANTQSISIAANKEERVEFKIVADATISIAKVLINVSNSNGEKFVDETEIAIRPIGGLQKINGSGTIAGGASQHLNINTSDFMSNSIDYQLVISRSPMIEFADQLRYLVQYPYGCTEQTISAAFPQLYFSDLADLLKKGKDLKSNSNFNVTEAIRKIKTRQLYNGGITLWDNEESEHWWASVYAAHFLIEAKKAGFDVDDNLLEPLLSFLNNKLKSKETMTYYFNKNQTKKVAPKEVAYSLYVLALAGRANISTMNYYKLNQGMLALDSKYLLSAAYAMAGDKKSFAALLPNSFVGEDAVTQTGGSFYSAIRDEAIALDVLLDADATNTQIGIMAKHLSLKLKSQNYLSTQERAFSFLAIGKMARNTAKSTVTAQVKVNGKIIATVNDKVWKADAALLKNNQMDIITTGSGNLYYSWVSEGISTSGRVKEEDNFMKVRKQFYDRFGNTLQQKTFKQNDLIVIGITLENAYNGSIDNIVITDMLPAGFEIENARTKEIPGMDWIKNGSKPTSMDVRDDRINLFVNLYSNKQTYYYAVRAVSPGNYKMGAVSADAMYNGEYHSYNGSGVIKIVR